ncbi:MAG: hypothetical protein ACO3MB_13110 [Saprospiraceae bacterium]
MDDYTDIEKSMENYYRQLIADDIDNSLYRRNSPESISDEQIYWLNNGLRMAAMIARYGDFD